MEQIGFPWNNNPIVKNEYRKDNYKIIETNAATNRALICCSGNGLYYPNDEHTFIDVIITKNRYEWENIISDKHIKRTFSKIILIRDIYKQWYVTGINHRINSMDLLIDFLKSITQGYQVTICGNSAGGYAAVAIGFFLDAETVFNFSGQYTLCDQFEKAPLLQDKKDNESVSKYYDLIELFHKYNVDNWKNTYHFYPGRCEWDVWQASKAENTKVHQYPMDSDLHGATIRSSCYSYILTVPNEILNQLCVHLCVDVGGGYRFRFI